MNPSKIDDLLTEYEMDVRFPDVSGMEHLDMLLARSELAMADHDDMLTAEQRIRLAEADRVLASQAGRFYRAIRRVADLAAWRQQEGAPPDQWWWYLDVLAQAPVGTSAEFTAIVV